MRGSVTDSGPSQNEPARTRILIVDDHPMTREGLRAAFDDAPDIEVVGEAASGEAAIALAEEVAPDVVFMDVRMPGMSGIEATEKLLERRPDTNVVILTFEESGAGLEDAFRKGAKGFLLKDLPAEELVGAARLAARGSAVIHPTLVRSFVGNLEPPEGPSRPPLSHREMEILQLVAYGNTSKAVGTALGISTHTVKTHMERIFEKLQASARAHAVAIAIRNGLVD